MISLSGANDWCEIAEEWAMKSKRNTSVTLGIRYYMNSLSERRKEVRCEPASNVLRVYH